MDYYSIKVFLPWFIWISSMSFLDQSRAQPGTASLDCIGKLLPCQPYLQSSSPPDTCCTPLAGMVDGEGDCFCQIFNDPGLLKSFNVTQEQALKLPKNCGMNADVSGCKNREPPIIYFFLFLPNRNCGFSPSKHWHIINIQPIYMQIDSKFFS